ASGPAGRDQGGYWAQPHLTRTEHRGSRTPPRNIAAVCPRAFCKRRQLVLGLSPRETPRACALAPLRPTLCDPVHFRDRLRRRVRRPVLFQPHLPAALRDDPVRRSPLERGTRAQLIARAAVFRSVRLSLPLRPSVWRPIA